MVRVIVRVTVTVTVTVTLVVTVTVTVLILRSDVYKAMVAIRILIVKGC